MEEEEEGREEDGGGDGGVAVVVKRRNQHNRYRIYTHLCVLGEQNFADIGLRAPQKSGYPTKAVGDASDRPDE